MQQPVSLISQLCGLLTAILIMPHTHKAIDVCTESEICAMGSVIVYSLACLACSSHFLHISIIFFKAAFTEYYTAIVET